MIKDELAAAVKTYMKEKGYKKRGTTWTKRTDDEISLVVNIQGSQYDKEQYYINLGIYVHALGTKGQPSISDCHMRERINTPVDTAELFCGIADKWEEWYGTYNKIYERVLQGKMPQLTAKNVYAYFMVKGKK